MGKKAKKTKRRKGRLVAASLLLSVSLLVVVGVVLASGWIHWSTLSELNFSLAGETVRLNGAQTWYFFDKSSRLMGSPSQSGDVVLSFGLLSGPEPAIEGKNVGWIRVEEWFKLMNDMPGTPAIGLFYEYYVFFRALEGSIWIDGQKIQNLGFVPWADPGKQLTNYNPTICQSYDSALGRPCQVAFVTLDKAGAMRAAAFYLILDPSKRPDDCSKYPSACVDLSSYVAKGKDFTISTPVKEYWDDYELISWPWVLPRGQSCLNSNSDPSQWNFSGQCVLRLTHQEVDIKWGAKLTDFGYFTTTTDANERPTTSFVQTQSTTAMETVRIYVSSGVSGRIIVEEVHTDTTIRVTETPGHPGVGGFCDLYPDFFTCKWWPDLSNIPIWAILLAIIMIVALVLLARRKRAAGPSGGGVNITFLINR